MKLSSFVATQDLTLDLSEFVEEGEDSTLHVTVDQNAVTPALMMRIEKAGDTDAAILVDAVVKIVKKWDLIGDSKKPIPITEAAVADIGAFFLFALLSKINEGLGEEVAQEGKVSAAAS